MIVVKDRPLKNYPAVAENNFIDKHVFAKLRHHQRDSLGALHG